MKSLSHNNTTKSILWMHEKFLYPVVRVFGQRAAGSGTVIHSREGVSREGEFETFVLTNHHVIEDCISHKKDWDSILKRNVEKEFLEKAHVETFSYVNMSTVDSSNRYKADIVAYDKSHDLALLKVDSPLEFKYVAKIIPRKEIDDIKLFMEVVACGCSLGHEPLCNHGHVTFLKEIIDKKKYIISSAGVYFGNSGGALYLAETGDLIGVPSRVAAVQLGFGVDVISWVAFSAHPERIYEFLDEQEMKFIYERGDTFAKALTRRQQKEKDAILALKAEIARQSEEESDF